MSPAVALEILKTASGMAPLNRNDHVKVMQAVSILEEALRNSEKKDG